jgi:hypothetical protein
MIGTDDRTHEVKEFQCPGCTIGCDGEKFEAQTYPSEDGRPGIRCSNHSAGTFLSGVGQIFLGMPKGFSRVGPRSDHLPEIWFFDEIPEYDFLNIPVWGMEKDGYLFIRVFLPRTVRNMIHVVKDGKFADLASKHQGVFDLATEIDNID